MTRPEHMNLETADITSENIDKIAALFPNCLTEKKNDEGKVVKAIDFDLLRQELSHDIVEGPEERYQFNWPEKRKAIRLANTPSDMTLRPCREESVNFDTTENLYIEGDNLEVLKLLRENYLGKVKMIYIDLPYNTGHDFIYNDTLKSERDDFLLADNQIDEAGMRLVENTEANGRFHTSWINMIYPRLRVARDLLDKDGVVLISIDHHEVINISKVADEIFGATNKVGLISVINNLKGRSDDAFFATCNEFLLVYAKSRKDLLINGFEVGEEEIEGDYNLQDEIGKYKLIGFRKTGNAWQRESRAKMFYPVLYKNGEFGIIKRDELDKLYDSISNTFNDEYLMEMVNKYKQLGYDVILPKTDNGEYGRWRWGVETFLKEKDFNLGFNDAGTLCTKMRATIEDGSIRTKTAKTLWYKPEYDTGSGARVLKNLFNGKEVFDNPKSWHYIQDVLNVFTNNESIVLDLFSGSSTTAHALMSLNAIDKLSKRRYIMVQLPVNLDLMYNKVKANEAKKIVQNAINFLDGINRPHTISEIGKERIRRAGKKIAEENATNAPNLDIGFRVLKLDSSNMEKVKRTPSEFANELMQGKLNLGGEQEMTQATMNFDADLSLASNIKPGRTGEDLLFQIMPRFDIPLSAKIAVETIGGKKVFNVDDGYLLASFDKDLDEGFLTEIAKRKPVFFAMCDAGFASDNVADNFEQIWREYSPETVRRVI